MPIKKKSFHTIISLLSLLLFLGACSKTRAVESNWSSSFVQQPLNSSVIYPGKPERDGYINVLSYAGVDPSGKTDSTEALQKALNDSIERGKITFLPPGTYLVSDTLKGIQNFQRSGCAEHIRGYLNKAGNVIRKAAVLVGGLNGERPIIKLKDNSPGFNNKKNPKSVIKFINNRQDEWHGGTDCHMSAVIRGIQVDIGANNPGAIGIEFPAAQYSTMENIKVNANDGYAGIRGVPTVNISVNLEVNGGDYGILPEVCCGISMVGVRLKNQKKAAIKAMSYTTIGITGFEIESRSAIPILIVGMEGAHTSQLSLLDGIIIAPSKTPAIDNSNGSDLHINNVYIKGTALLIKSAESISRGKANQWHRIVEYNYTDQRAEAYRNTLVQSYKLIDGKRHKDLISNIENVSSAPNHLIAKHQWQHIPSQFGKNVFNVIQDGNAKGDGKTDDTQALQDAINQHQFVYLPVGDYQISDTLRLKKDTRLFGSSGSKSRLFADDWNPTKFQAMIKTVDDANAETYIGDIYIELPKGKSNSYLSGLDWRAGKNSWARHLYIDMQWSNRDYDSYGRKVVSLSGNAGGRFYGLTMHLLSSGNNSNHPDHRLLYINANKQPVTFYGSNLEHSRTTQIELYNAHNVRMIGGMKFESFDALKIVDSNNIFISGLSAHSTIVRVEDSTNIVIPAFINYRGLHHKVKSKYMFTETYKGQSFSINANNNLGLFKRGDFDFRPF